MENINTIYYNNFGIAFQWKRCAVKDFKKIQLVFRNTGLFLTEDELIHFSKNIKDAFYNPALCYCKENTSCKSLLLQTPNTQTTFAMSYNELQSIADLVDNTIFYIGLNNFLKHKNIY